MANFGSISVNPNFDWGSFLGNALTDLSAGLATQNTVGKALGAAAVQNADLQPARAAAAVQKQTREEAKVKSNKTREYLSLHAPELVPVYDSDPNAAMEAYVKKVTPKQAGLMNVNGHVLNDITGAQVADYSADQGGGASFGTMPVFLMDDKGNQHAGQMSSGGGIFVDGKTLPGIPAGWQVIARPENLKTVDTGGTINVFDPNKGTTTPLLPKQGAPSANLDVTLNPDGTRTAAPMAGSPEAVKARGDRTAAQTSLGMLEQKQGLVSDSIDRAVQMAQSVPSTGVFSLINAVPGTPQYDLKATLDTIKANVGFDQLQQMRDASPTGGALGQVSEQENRLLQSVLGSLDQAQSKDQFITNLQALKQLLAQSTDARRRAFAQDFPDAGGQAEGAVDYKSKYGLE